MTNVNELKQSRFLTQHEVDPMILVTITEVRQMNVAMEGAEPEMRWTLAFAEIEKSMTLNITNGQVIAEIAGTDILEEWPGTKIVLYRDKNISFGGKLVGGIRCRAPKTKAEPIPGSATVDDLNRPQQSQEPDSSAPTGDDIPF